MRLALAWDAEIVSVDSMQVYRGMDIGTAKPTPAEQAVVPHHMIDVADPADEYDVATFQREARRAIDEIHGRGKSVLIVGARRPMRRKTKHTWPLIEVPHEW